MRIGAKSQTPDCIKHLRARFPANLRAGVQHPRNRPDATPAARATSRMVVFAGTASIAIGVLVAFAPRLRFVGRGPRSSVTCESLTHIRATASKQRGAWALPALLSKKSQNRSCTAVLQDSDLTDAFCSDKVWNQFQSLWDSFEANGVCDEKTVWFLSRLHGCVCSAHWTRRDQTVALEHGLVARNNSDRIF